MRRILAVARREAAQLFLTPVGYLLLLVHAAVSGIAFVVYLGRFRQASLQVLQSPFLAEDLVVPLSAETWLTGPYLSTVGQILLFLLPFLTMASLAGERRSGTLEILMSTPATATEILVGKFLGALLALLALLGVNLLHLLLFALWSDPGWGTVGIGVGGLFLMGSALVALGLFVSCLSRGPLEAAVLTLGLLVGVALVGGSGGEAPWVRAARFLSPGTPLGDFTKGILSAWGVGRYLAAAFLWLALGLRGLDWIRWRGTGA
jgi:ABC-2 type transport system permease protein